MKRRIIINIDHDDMPDEKAVRLVLQIMARGRISTTAGREHYCHLCRIGSDAGEWTLIHATRRTDTTDTFSIYRESPTQRTDLDPRQAQR